jgi:ABC-type bacteriocin/lantibiotic exporter with double-glycine peptidase domain/CRP-like cAMP-binding protein
VRASTEVEVVRLDRSLFEALVRVHPELRDALRSQSRARSVWELLRLHSPFSELPLSALTEVVADLAEHTVPPGELVVGENDAGDTMYIIETGRLRAFTVVDGVPRERRLLGRGDYFGERSLLRDVPRSLSVETIEESRLLELDRRTFAALVRDHPSFQRRVEERIRFYERDEARRDTYALGELLPADATEAVVVQALESVDETSLDRELAARPAGPAVEKRRRFPLLRQIDEMDCGAACLAMICRYFGREVSLPYIREAVGTGLDGTSLRGIQRGGEFVGLDVAAVKASKDRLDDLPLPAIVHYGGNHWIVLYALEESHVRVADPALGLRRLPREELIEKWTGFAALPSPTERLGEAPETSSSMRWLIPFVRPHLAALVAALLLAICASALQMLFPVMMQRIVDDLLGHKSYTTLNLIALAMLGLLGLAMALTLIQGRLLSRVAINVDARTLGFLSDRMLRLPMSYFESRRSGDLDRRLDGMKQIREIVVQQGVQGVQATTQFGVALVFLAAYSWEVLLAFLCTVPFYVLLMRYSSRRLTPAFKRLEEAFGLFHSRRIDALKGIETIKVGGSEDAARQRIMREFGTLTDRIFRADMTHMSYNAVVSMTTFALNTVVLWVSAVLVLRGTLTVGELLAVNSLVLLANAPLRTILGLWDQIQLSQVLLTRVQDVLEQEPEQGADHERLRAVGELEGRVTLQKLSFRYPTAPTSPILTDVSIDIPAGTTVALVGRSGSGKSTLLRCLAGLIEPTSGAVLVDDVELRQMEYTQLRQKVGFVLQHAYLFDATLAENIAYGDDAPDVEQVRWAAQLANASEFIEALPLGYETRVGESGMRLSGGQAQRVAIARAIYRRPPLLLFDEATSALDTESERVVKENLDRLLEGRTAVIVAHRLSTIRDADIILVLEKGRLVEHGTHDELLRREGLYYHLHSYQQAD